MAAGVQYADGRTGQRQADCTFGGWYPEWEIDRYPLPAVELIEFVGECRTEFVPSDAGAMPSMDEWWEQCDLVRRRLAHQPRRAKVPVAAMIRKYEEATGTCVCCD